MEKGRRPELIRLLQYYMYGQLPPKPVLSATVERVDQAVLSGKATLSEVTLRFGRSETPPIHLMLVVPNRRTAPTPVVLALNYFGNHTLVHDKKVRLPDNWMPGWGGEEASSAKVVNNHATEAALDERIALAVPHQAGCGARLPAGLELLSESPITLWIMRRPDRRKTVMDINDQFPHWFNARFKEFNSQPERLPFDQNCLVALCAPRSVLFTNGRADTWINPAGQFEVLRAAAPVCRLLGAGDFTAEELPPDRQLIDGVLGYYLRPGGHSLLREDWKLFLDFADKRLARPMK